MTDRVQCLKSIVNILVAPRATKREQIFEWIRKAHLKAACERFGGI